MASTRSTLERIDNHLEESMGVRPSDSHLSGGNFLARWTHQIDDESDFSLQMYYDRADQEKILVDRVVYKLARCTLAEASHFSGESGADDHYIAWSNSLRLDLQALGLERREKNVMELGEYVKQSQALAPEGSR